MKLLNLRIQLREAETELEDLYLMSEEAACFRYLTDTKEEAITMVIEWIEDLVQQIEDAEAKNAPLMTIDPAFSSMAEFDRMRITL